jgi:hypothetical protein
MKRLRLIFLAVVGMTMAVTTSQAERVSGYTRKDGTQVSSYERNGRLFSSRQPSSPDGPHPVYTARESQRYAEPTEQLNKQDAPVTVYFTTPTPAAPTYTITRNDWALDTLRVYGTLTNPHVAMRITGFGSDRQLITESGDYLIRPDGTFQATLNDPKKEIRFLKVVLNDAEKSTSSIPAKLSVSCPD